jgi:regulator of replication initiation timing
MLGASLLLRKKLAGLLGLTTLWVLAANAQVESNPSQVDTLRQSVTELQEQIRALQSAVVEIRAEAAEYRAETRELRGELEATRAELQQQSTTAELVANSQVSPPQTNLSQEKTTASSTPSPSDRMAKLEDEYRLLTGKIDEQYQTKVESASRYRVRLSGIVLLNLFSNQGNVDNIDFPALALQAPAGFSGGSFGGTLRQSQLGFTTFGPHVAGARTSADLQFDFGGGFPYTTEGVNTGLVRLRTGTMRLDWENTSIVAGQDALFFSPLSPTSFATLAAPAFSYAGNLWNWVPQVRVEHRFSTSENSQLLVEGGILDPVSGEPPRYQSYRAPQAGELSRQPALATRVAWTRNVFGQPLTIGVGGYYSAQDYGYGRTVDAWAATSDWNLPLGSRFVLSGEFYRGKALGGLGGGIGRSVIFSDQLSNPSASVLGLDSEGGWSQLKMKASPKLEFNAAFGQDNPFASDLRYLPDGQAYLNADLARNRSAFVNAIYRPRSDLLFSAEYRHLRTFTIGSGNYSADHVNLMMGVLF